MKEKINKTFPRIGLRIMKSAIAVELCFLVSFIRGNSGIVFYSQLAALWCIQVYVQNSRNNAIQRIIGTVIGAVYGLIFLLLNREIVKSDLEHEVVNSIIISIMLVAVLYTTVIIRKKQASYFSCVVFLSIVVNHMSDVNPYLFVWNRFLDTVIGIVIGIGVNCFSLPKDKRKDVLFISGLDDILLDNQNVLSDYNKIELNRMLDEGVNFTISTIRTPASLIEPMRDIRLQLPVIAMDGAVLYDISEKMYIKSYVISSNHSNQVFQMIREQGLTCFTNVIVDDMLVIYYDEPEEEIQKKLVKDLRKSPYRNYVQREMPKTEYVVYFMLLYPSSVIENFYQILKEKGITEELKVLKYESTDYPGYSYIKIFNRNATKENMIAYLKEMLKLDKTVTFGSIPGKYDKVVNSGDTNQVVNMLKKLYEPLKLSGYRNKI